MLKTGTLNTLELMSKEEGKHMDNPESVKVQPFIPSPRLNAAQMADLISFPHECCTLAKHIRAGASPLLESNAHNQFARNNKQGSVT